MAEVTTVFVSRRGDPELPWRDAFSVAGSAFAAFIAGYSRCALPVISLIALGGGREWPGVLRADAAAYPTARDAAHVFLAVTGCPAAAVAVVPASIRRSPQARSRAGGPSPQRR